jgi:hypothetical protein
MPVPTPPPESAKTLILQAATDLRRGLFVFDVRKSPGFWAFSGALVVFAASAGAPAVKTPQLLALF